MGEVHRGTSPARRPTETACPSRDKTSGRIDSFATSDPFLDPWLPVSLQSDSESLGGVGP